MVIALFPDFAEQSSPVRLFQVSFIKELDLRSNMISFAKLVIPKQLSKK